MTSNKELLRVALNTSKNTSKFIASEVEKTLKINYIGATDLLKHVDVTSEEIIR